MIELMPKLLAIVYFCLACLPAGAEIGLPENFREAVRFAQNTPYSVSASGQFLVHGAPPDGWRQMALSQSLEKQYARLDAALLAVTCDRVKSALLAELGMQDQWQGRISIFLHQAHRLDETIVIGSSDSQGDWTYYVNLPDTVQRTRLVSALVNVMLLEMANRKAERSAEIPPWLSEGLTQQLMQESMGGLVMEMPRDGNQNIHMSAEVLDGRSVPPLEQAHEVLLGRPPLTIGELSWPSGDVEDDPVFRSSAQLFVCRLLELNNGRQCLQNMIQELPLHLNWQISFLNAFHAHFASPLELEKWWALCLVNFTGRDLAQTWPHAESWQKLDETLRTGAAVRTAVDEMPLRTQVTLQSVISGWGYTMQAEVLRLKLRQLGLLRESVSQDLAGLVDGYRQVLQNYLLIRQKSGAFRTTTAERVLGPDNTALETIRLLNSLDAEREAMRNGPELAPQTAASTVNH
jgi:hypothetical protein